MQEHIEKSALLPTSTKVLMKNQDEPKNQTPRQINVHRATSDTGLSFEKVFFLKLSSKKMVLLFWTRLNV